MACAPLTPRQAECLTFLKSRATAPSFEEIAAALHISSKSGVCRLLKALEERGFIRRTRLRARCIEVVAPDPLASATNLQLLEEIARRGIRVAACARCDARPGSLDASRCTRIDCGLSGRHNMMENAA